MKSFTNLEQSKKLAEILPLESADMEYMFLKKDGSKVSNVPFVKDGFEEHECCYIFISCWSLAALIDILPQSIEFKGDNYYLRFMKDYVEYANDEVSLTGVFLWTTGNGNLVDACVEMIEKLHKQKLL
jgi:hypothetical protein